MKIVEDIFIIEFEHFNEYDAFVKYMDIKRREGSKFNPNWYYCNKSNSIIFKKFNSTDTIVKDIANEFMELYINS